MILLITKSTKALECGDGIAEALWEPVKIATTVRQASRLLREGKFRAAIVDQQLQEHEPGEIDYAVSHMGLGTAIYIDLAIAGTERIIRELRTALHRREKELFIAKQAAEQQLRDEMKDVVTALFLSLELALQVTGIPLAVELKLRTANDLLRRLQETIRLNVKVGICPNGGQRFVAHELFAASSASASATKDLRSGGAVIHVHEAKIGRSTPSS